MVLKQPTDTQQLHPNSVVELRSTTQETEKEKKNFAVTRQTHQAIISSCFQGVSFLPHDLSTARTVEANQERVVLIMCKLNSDVNLKRNRPRPPSDMTPVRFVSKGSEFVWRVHIYAKSAD